jgi:hypothetical protein
MDAKEGAATRRGRRGLAEGQTQGEPTNAGRHNRFLANDTSIMLKSHRLRIFNSFLLLFLICLVQVGYPIVILRFIAMLTQQFASSFQRRAHSVISGRPQVSANVRISSTIETVHILFVQLITNDRYMFWDKFLHPPPGHPRQPFPAVPLLHQAMVSKPESAHLRRRHSGRHGPRYSDG